jgi:hypothetical protein
MDYSIGQLNLCRSKRSLSLYHHACNRRSIDSWCCFDGKAKRKESSSWNNVFPRALAVLPAGCDRILCVRPEETLAGGDRVKPGEEAPPASPRKGNANRPRRKKAAQFEYLQVPIIFKSL